MSEIIETLKLQQAMKKITEEDLKDLDLELEKIKKEKGFMFEGEEDKK